MADQGKIEGEVRRRLTEAASAAGVPHSRASLEVLYLLPDAFLRAYVDLWDAALKLPGSSTGGLGRQGDLGKAGSNDPMPGTAKGLRINSGKEGGGAAPHLGGSTPKRGPGGWSVKDARMLELKEKIDKRLRALARDVRKQMAGEEEEEIWGAAGRGGAGGGGKASACAGCGRLAEKSWKHCPNCGSKL